MTWKWDSPWYPAGMVAYDIAAIIGWSMLALVLVSVFGARLFGARKPPDKR